MLYREFQIAIQKFPLGIKFKQKGDTPQYPYKIVIESITAESMLSSFLEPNNGLIRVGEIDVRFSSLQQLGQIFQKIKPTEFPIMFTFAVPIEDAETGLEKSFAGPETQTVQDQLAVINRLDNQPYPVTTLPIRSQPTFQHAAPIPNLPFENQVNNSDVMNANDLKKRVFSIDSRFRGNLDITSSTDFIFKLDSPIKNAIRVKLASFEFPFYYFTFSEQKGNTSFILNYAGKDYLIKIPDGTYDMEVTSTGEYVDTNLLQVIQNQFNELYNGGAGPLPVPFKIDLDFSTGEVSIYIPTVYIPASGGNPAFPAQLPNLGFTLDFTGTKFSDRQADWGLGYYLGYRKKKYVLNLSNAGLYPNYNPETNTITSEAVVDTTGDSYVFLQINDYSNLEHKLDNGQVLNAFAKIQLASNPNTVVFIDSINLLYREIVFQNPQNISYFKIRVVDPYGEIIDSRNMNLSMAFEVTQVMNGELYDFYRNYMFKKINSM